ncbi:MAG: acyl carrier protein [Okeania sp. SIO2F4]|nr:acyl carrier protein [Okeania sp. SIO2F4]
MGHENNQTKEAIEEWLISYLAENLEMNQDEIDVDIPFDRYGLDSSTAIMMTGDLRDFIGFEIDETLPYDYPTIESLSQYLFDAQNNQSK